MNSIAVTPVRRHFTGLLAKAGAGTLESPRSCSAPTIHLFLTNGQVEIDGENVRLPVGLPNRLTGLQLKALSGKYKGMLLFWKKGDSWQRLGDNDVIETTTDDIRLKTQQPVVRTAPRFHRD